MAKVAWRGLCGYTWLSLHCPLCDPSPHVQAWATVSSLGGPTGGRTVMEWAVVVATWTAGQRLCWRAAVFLGHPSTGALSEPAACEPGPFPGIPQHGVAPAFSKVTCGVQHSE